LSEAGLGVALPESGGLRVIHLSGDGFHQLATFLSLPKTLGLREAIRRSRSLQGYALFL
ncbi:hypothetical protein CRG98_034132, partial [Punica granatum]